MLSVTDLKALHILLHLWWARAESPNLFTTNPGDKPNCVVYIEQGSKNRYGGLGDLQVENKEVPCHAVRANVLNCLVFLLELAVMLLLSIDLAMKPVGTVCLFCGGNFS